MCLAKDTWCLRTEEDLAIQPRAMKLFLGLCALLAASSFNPVRAEPENAPIPVIFDTDLGEDIDDMWALAFLVHSPELDLKLVTINFGDVNRKARMVAKALTAFGRDDVTIAIGRTSKRFKPRYYKWAKDFDISKYAGRVSRDAVGEIIRVIEADQTSRLKILPVGSMKNIAAMIEKRPDLAKQVELVAMSGHVAEDPAGNKDRRAETNVRVEVGAAKIAYAADWKRFTTAPLNVTGMLKLTDDHYQRILKSEHPTARTLIEAYKVFEPTANWGKHDVSKESSSLHDVVAVYLAFSTEHLNLETLPLRVTDKGYTIIDPDHGKPVRVALEWQHLEAFKELLVKRLTSPPSTDKQR